MPVAGIALVLMLGAAWQTASGDTVSFIRTFHVGDKDVYDISVTSKGGQLGDSALSMSFTEEVVHALSDGGAEIKFTSSLMKLTYGTGATAQNLEYPSSTENMRVSKVGSPNELSDHNGIRISWVGTLTEALGALKGGLAVGQSAPFDSIDPPLTNRHTDGTVKLTEIKDGIAVLSVAADQRFIGGPPAEHVVGTYWIDVSAAKVNKADFTITDLSNREGVAHATMVRKK